MIDDEEPEPRLLELLADLVRSPAVPACRTCDERAAGVCADPGASRRGLEPVLFGGMIPILGARAIGFIIWRAVRDTDDKED